MTGSGFDLDDDAAAAARAEFEKKLDIVRNNPRCIGHKSLEKLILNGTCHHQPSGRRVATRSIKRWSVPLSGEEHHLGVFPPSETGLSTLLCKCSLLTVHSFNPSRQHQTAKFRRVDAAKRVRHQHLQNLLLKVALE
jgi:hypothetical protein